ncbi:hypothetical protein GCM10010207_12680 [Streptomyces atratus]|nr:hypothetical protein GCM10010207_12680 [Streptomyces atratus]
MLGYNGQHAQRSDDVYEWIATATAAENAAATGRMRVSLLHVNSVASVGDIHSEVAPRIGRGASTSCHGGVFPTGPIDVPLSFLINSGCLSPMVPLSGQAGKSPLVALMATTPLSLVT